LSGRKKYQGVGTEKKFSIRARPKYRARKKSEEGVLKVCERGGNSKKGSVKRKK